MENKEELLKRKESLLKSRKRIWDRVKDFTVCAEDAEAAERSLRSIKTKIGNIDKKLDKLK